MGSGGNRVLVTVTACQTDGADQDRIEAVYPGRGYGTDDGYYLFYDEVDPGNGRVTRVSLRIRPGHVNLRKRGEVSTQMDFVPGKRTDAEYSTPFGMFSITVDTERAEVIREDGGVEVKLDYHLDMGLSCPMGNRLTIKAAEL